VGVGWNEWLEEATQAPNRASLSTARYYISTVREAVRMHPRLKGHVDILPHGSWAYNIVVNGISDIDIAVVWRDGRYTGRHGPKQDPRTTMPAVVAEHVPGQIVPDPWQLRGWMTEALHQSYDATDRVWRSADQRSDQITAKDFSIRLQDRSVRRRLAPDGLELDLDTHADVVPCFRYQLQTEPGDPADGILLFADREHGRCVHNFPDRISQRVAAKDADMNGEFRRFVRAAKRLAKNMRDAEVTENSAPGYLLLSCFWHVPAEVFTEYSSMRWALFNAWSWVLDAVAARESDTWTEINGTTLLFGDHQRWDSNDLLQFASACVQYLHGWEGPWDEKIPEEWTYEYEDQIDPGEHVDDCSGTE
jgi:hypothetical protein